LRRASCGTTASIASRTTFRDDREAPLWRARDGVDIAFASVKQKKKFHDAAWIFLIAWDGSENPIFRATKSAVF
jgi:hypothetical protein